MITEHFKSWLSGFIDGEGCFACVISYKRIKDKEYLHFNPMFVISLRSDDVEAIEKIQQYLGGKISFVQIDKENQGDQVRLSIQGCYNCQKVINHIDKYPLIAKKRNDYIIWKKIIRLLKAKEHLKGNRQYILNLIEHLRNSKKFIKQDIPVFEDKQQYFEVI